MGVRLAGLRVEGPMKPRCSALLVLLARKIRQVPIMVWLVAVALLVVPWYLAYVAIVLTRVGGVETFMPRIP